MGFMYVPGVAVGVSESRLCSGFVYEQFHVYGTVELRLQCSGGDSAASAITPSAVVMSWGGMAVVTGELVWHMAVVTSVSCRSQMHHQVQDTLQVAARTGNNACCCWRPCWQWF